MSITINQLINHARKVMENAYSPYSKIKIGAAILTKKGNIYTGCNIENASYSLTICAERAAAFSAISSGEREFAAIAIVANSENIIPYPCGACRQVLAEFSTPDLSLYISNSKNNFSNYEELSLGSLLPKNFKI